MKQFPNCKISVNSIVVTEKGHFHYLLLLQHENQ